MRYICIIQARTTSSRLPAKSLLPIAKMPLAILVAKRAISNFHETWVITSKNESDDLLSSYLETSKIPYFRGELDNVLNRFCSLCLKLKAKPEDTIIRLTADNPLVDDSFLENMKIIWEKYNLDYLSAEPDNLMEYGWPKGLSAEFFRAESIYAINNNQTDDYIKEHVTPSIKKKSKRVAHMAEYENLGFAFKRRYGIDFLDDYLFVSSLFQSVDWNTNYSKILEIGKNLEIGKEALIDG